MSLSQRSIAWPRPSHRRLLRHGLDHAILRSGCRGIPGIRQAERDPLCPSHADGSPAWRPGDDSAHAAAQARPRPPSHWSGRYTGVLSGNESGVNYEQEQKKRRTGGNRYDAVHARDTDECKSIISDISRNARGECVPCQRSGAVTGHSCPLR